MSGESEPPYLSIVRKKQAARRALIPAHWITPSSLLPKDPPKLEYGPQNVLSVPAQVLTPAELAITEFPSVRALLSAIESRRLSARTVAEAFCHRAAIAQQLTNCITEPLFDSAIERAEKLDQYLDDNGRVFGPLHGLPVSVKDTFNVKGVDSSMGLTALCFQPAETNSPMVDMLLSLGCVIVAKTNIPQTLQSLDSINHVFGRTMNPINRMCTAGGSSGGEGVLVAMRGSMVGIGTDIGGSIRVPAMCNGVYGFKPSEGRFPHGGQAITGRDGMGRAGVQSVTGPIAGSMDDIECFLKAAVPQATLWGGDCISGSWDESTIRGSGSDGKFVIGVLRGDGNCELLPPITKLMNETAAKLNAAFNMEVVELATPKAWTQCQSLMSKLMGIDGGEKLAAWLEKTQEPLVPWMQSRFRSGKPKALTQVADWQTQRATVEQEMSRLWTKQDSYGRRTSRLDAIICPLAAHPVPPIDGYNAVGYTSSWVLLDYPAGSIPVRSFNENDLELGKALEGKSLGSWDERNRELWDESKVDRKIYLGTPMSIQVVAPRLQDERLALMMRLIDQAVKVHIPGKAKL